MLAVLLGCMLICLVLGFPMMTGMLLGPVAAIATYLPNLQAYTLGQYYVTGITSFVLLAVPMFMFAGNIMGSGQMADRLMNFVKSLVAHLPGGVAITAAGTCTIFGAISGSAPATLVAVGMPMYKPLLNQGYKDEHILSLLSSTANIAILIPPSVMMVIYSVCANASVGDMFIAGIVPGLMMFILFSIWEVIYAKRHNIVAARKTTAKERLVAFKEAILPLGFPVIVLGGIYTGIFSPTEAAAVSCVYAMIVEIFIFKSIKISDLPKLALKTGRVVATTYILMASGKAISYLLSYSGAAATIAKSLLGENPSALAVLAAISLVYIVACCFIDSIPVTLIVVPIFFETAMAAGIHPIHLGIVVTFWSALGCITPPFGCNLFVAIAIFRKSFTVLLKGIWPYLGISVFIGVLLVLFPQLSLFLL